MPGAFSDVRVLVWDFDGTLYKAIPALHDEILEADYLLVMKHTGWSREKTVTEFRKIFQVKTPSSTETAALLAGITLREAAIECERYKDRTKYLKRDEQLIKTFEKLSTYTHYILANGIREKIVPALSVLGVPQETFREIVTSEVVGVNKPQLQGFQYIMGKTGLKPEAHLMIGDREAVDLVPAKALGWLTCLVWSEKPSAVADGALSSVYEVPGMLG